MKDYDPNKEALYFMYCDVKIFMDGQCLKNYQLIVLSGLNIHLG